MGKRRGMQNQPDAAGPKGPGPFTTPFAALAQPKVVLMAAGLFGLAVDLFVRPLTWVGLALIVLATAPWTLQAWSERFAGRAEREPGPQPAKAGAAPDPAARARPEQQIVAGAQKPGTARPVQPVAGTAPARQAAVTERAPEGERRPAPLRPQRLPETPPVARQVRPETAG